MSITGNIWSVVALKRGSSPRVTVVVELEDLFAAVDHRTRLVALSYVQFLSGFRLAAQRIGEFCRERGVYFFLDAIQGLGAMHLDVQHVPWNV
jgi:selenocysteine lyase/cysteine desulfurase